MKTKLSVSLVLMLIFSLVCSAALGATANGAIVAKETVKMTAPFSGTLKPFDLTAGEEIAAGDILFEIDTLPVYAGESGTVAAVLAAEGDDAAALVSRYGAIAWVEPEHPLYIDADTSDAYDDDDNRYIHAGESVYLKCGNEKGTGMITSVSGKKYAVQVLSGHFELEDTVRCFRESAMPSSSEIGRGKVRRYADAGVTASGRIAAVHVQPGDQILTGDLLFELIDAQSEKGVSPAIAAPVSGAVSMLSAASGAQVYRGQLLCEIADLTKLELRAEIDELDLPGLRVGDTLSYTLDAYAGQTFSGTVTEIRPLGTARQNAAYFDVRITAPQGVSILPGMNATVIIGE